MLYKSKAMYVFLGLAIFFALAAVGLVITHFIVKNDYFLVGSVLSATLFFVSKASSDLINVRYVQRSDKAFLKKVAIGEYIGGGICLIVAIIQLIGILKG